MDGRGRKSTASLTIVPLAPHARMEPPASLTPTQCEIWRDVVQSRPSDWFDAASVPLLLAYVRAVDLHRSLSAQVDQLGEKLAHKGRFRRYQDLLSLQEKQARLIAALARSMRLSQQATRTDRNARAAAKHPTGAKPWENPQ